jgi:hypothetical protein
VVSVNKIDAALCERLINSAVSHCPAVSSVQASAATATPQPNFDALSASFGALSTALTIGSIIIAIIAVVAAGGWGYFVKVWAEKEARTEAQIHAKAVVDAYMLEWRSNDAPALVAEHVRLLANASVGNGSCDDCAAENIGKEAG